VSGSIAAGGEIAGYRIRDLVGEGSSGSVYVADDVSLQRPVALKVLAARLARDAAFRERFVRESHIAASLDHPHIVPIYAAGEAEGVLFLAMRYVDGPDLRKLLDTSGRLAPERALTIVTHIGLALDAAHAKGLVHRDVKPGNVLLAQVGETEHAYLSDFGLAKHSATPASLTGERALVGTIDYVAPEQIEGGPVDGRADLYALGCVLVECFTGSPPFRRQNQLAVLHAHLAAPPPRVSEGHPELPERLDAVIAGALAKDPDARYRSCGEFVAAARAALAGHEPSLPAGARAAEAAVRTFLFADVRGYTAFTRERGDEAAGRLASAFAELVRVVARDHAGVLQELRGDEALVVFDSSREALRCAVDLQRRFGGAGFELGVGIGLDSGEAVPVHGGFRGGALNLAARLCDRAGPGQVLASQAVLHLAAKVDGLAYVHPRLLKLKGYDEPVRALEVVPAEAVPANFAGALRRSAGRLRRTFVRTALAQPKRTLALAGTLVVVGAIAAALLLLGRGSSTAELRGIPANSVGRIDAATNRLVGVTRVGSGPTLIAAGEGAIWVANLDDRTLSRIDPATGRETRRISTEGAPTGLAAGEGGVWVAEEFDGELTRVDPRLNEITATIPLGNGVHDVAVGAGAVWAVNELEGTVVRVDPATHAIEATIKVGGSPEAIAVGGGAVWVTSGRAVVRVDPQREALTRIALRSEATDIAVGAGAVWVSNRLGDQVTKIDPGAGAATGAIGVGDDPVGISADRRAVWVANSREGSVSRIDPSTSTVVATIEARNAVEGVVVDRGMVWATAPARSWLW
jgi:class 3 adenylate cyclase/DNA-binding beta-propeller fold protein YncE